MIPVACLTLVVLALVALLHVEKRAHASAESAWAVERRQLCDRIQAPERLPVEPTQTFVIPEREPDEWAKVGTVEIDDKYGLEDDD